jgi:hypothetical protein
MVLRTEVQQNKYCSVVVKLDYRFKNYFKKPKQTTVIYVGQDCHPYLVCLWIFMVLRTEIQQNKYCSVILKLKEFFYVDYRFENYFKCPCRPLSGRTRLSSIFCCLWIFSFYIQTYSRTNIVVL